MSSVAFFVPAPDGQPVQVEVEDIYSPLCTVRAISGKPFVGGDKWPVRTEFAVVQTSSILVMRDRSPQSNYPAKADICHNLEE